MGYIEDNLMPNESIFFRAKLHWIIFKWPIIFCVLAVIFFAGGKANPGPAFLLFAAISIIPAAINFNTSEFGITNKRVLMKTGLIKRNSIEILLTKVEGIKVNQGILGRMLGYGTIVVSGTGGLKDPFHQIAAPLEFRSKVNEQIDTIGSHK